LISANVDAPCVSYGEALTHIQSDTSHEATHFVATRAPAGRRYTGTSGRPSSTSMA
jgi:hypothetical protein